MWQILGKLGRGVNQVGVTILNAFFSDLHFHFLRTEV